MFGCVNRLRGIAFAVCFLFACPSPAIASRIAPAKGGRAVQLKAPAFNQAL
jgi:hypothetical protein